MNERTYWEWPRSDTRDQFLPRNRHDRSRLEDPTPPTALTEPYLPRTIGRQHTKGAIMAAQAILSPTTPTGGRWGFRTLVRDPGAVPDAGLTTNLATSQGETHHLVRIGKLLHPLHRRGVVLSVGVVITVGHEVRLPGTIGPTGRTRPPVPDAHSSTGGSALMNHACNRYTHPPLPTWVELPRVAADFVVTLPQTAAGRTAPAGGQS